MSVIVTQDDSHPEGGYAVLRFPEVTVELDRASLLFQPVDDLPSDGARWPRGRIQAIETRLRDGVLEVVVGPDAVNALPAYTAVYITLTGVDQKTRKEFDLKDECRWPALVMLQQRRRRKLPDVAQPEVTEPVEYRQRRRSYSVPSTTDSEFEETEITSNRAAELGSQQIEPVFEQLEKMVSEHTVPESSEPAVSESSTQQELKLAGSDGSDISERPAPLDLKLPGSDKYEERKEEDEAKGSDDTTVSKSRFGRDGALAPPPRTRFAVLPIAIALLVGIAAGGLGYRQFFSVPEVISGGGLADGSSTADDRPADRLLMEALDSVDTTPDGASIFLTSKDDLWGKAYASYQARDFASAAKGYRMAIRVTLKNGGVPNLLEGLGAALQASETTRSDATRLSRLLYSLSALAGDPEAFCRLADSYAVSDPDYARRLRDRARALGGNNQAAQGC